jgi:hypothetical protein
MVANANSGGLRRQQACATLPVPHYARPWQVRSRPNSATTPSNRAPRGVRRLAGQSGRWWRGARLSPAARALEGFGLLVLNFGLRPNLTPLALAIVRPARTWLDPDPLVLGEGAKAIVPRPSGVVRSKCGLSSTLMGAPRLLIRSTGWLVLGAPREQRPMGSVLADGGRSRIVNPAPIGLIDAIGRDRVSCTTAI